MRRSLSKALARMERRSRHAWCERCTEVVRRTVCYPQLRVRNVAVRRRSAHMAHLSSRLAVDLAFRPLREVDEALTSAASPSSP